MSQLFYVVNCDLLYVCCGPKFHKKAHSIKKYKEDPICAAKRIDIKALYMFRFPAKNVIKKSSKIQWKNRAKIPRGLGSSGRAAQWDWDNSKGVLRNTRNEEQICPSQAPNGAAKNQKASRVTIHEQKAGTPGNPKFPPNEEL